MVAAECIAGEGLDHAVMRSSEIAPASTSSLRLCSRKTYELTSVSSPPATAPAQFRTQDDIPQYGHGYLTEPAARNETDILFSVPPIPGKRTDKLFPAPPTETDKSLLFSIRIESWTAVVEGPHATLTLAFSATLNVVVHRYQRQGSPHLRQDRRQSRKALRHRAPVEAP